MELIPTVVELDKYMKAEPKDLGQGIHVVWIGTPETSKYIQLVHGVFQKLAQNINIMFHVIGVDHYHIDGVKVRSWRWHEDTEAEIIAGADIGIMPLPDRPWERGKCGLKLLQYMAAGIAVVATPIGINSDIVQNGENGYLAVNEKKWVHSMRKLINDKRLRKSIWENKANVRLLNPIV